MDRWWFLSWSAYGTWLPGDPRGSIASVRDGPGPRHEHDKLDQPVETPMPGLHAASAELMKGPPIYLSRDHADALFNQFQETARHRDWFLRGVAIMANHLHMIVGVWGDPDPEKLVCDFKAWGSRALNRRYGKPASDTWWTSGGGSRRKIKSDAELLQKLQYLRDQPYPLLIWIADDHGIPVPSKPGKQQ